MRKYLNNRILNEPETFLEAINFFLFTFLMCEKIEKENFFIAFTCIILNCFENEANFPNNFLVCCDVNDMA